MKQEDFEKGLLASAAWQLAASNNVSELLAIACVIRNYVMRLGCRSYGDAINRVYAIRAGKFRPLPTGNEPHLVDPAEGLLVQVDSIYDNSAPDVTSSLANPNGATLFIDPRNETAPVGRRLIGNFGSMQFYE